MDTDCITNAAWIAYANKSLTAAELQLLETHVLTCEICTDIKEGIDTMSQPAGLENKMLMLQKKVDVLVRSQRSLRVYWRPLAAAAVFFLCIGLGWVMFTMQQRKL